MPHREDLRRALMRLVDWPEAPGPTRGRTVATIPHENGHWVEEIVLDTPTPIPGTLIRPARVGPHPAVLYCHAHGGDYRLGRQELLKGSRFLQSPGYGPPLAAAGLAVLCIDMPSFGDRRDEGEENDLAKGMFWQGKSLFGAMLADLSTALSYLANRPDVDDARIFTLGLSMGAAHAFWLAALETGIAGCAHLCMLADISELAKTNTHARHGFYLTVPGLLQLADMGDVAGLIAPRPQMICHGGQDHLTPAEARDAALAKVKAAYAHCPDPDALTCALDPDAGHGETAPMRIAVLDFLARAAAPGYPAF
ncbi:dienelactone hydrolase family protein [Pseudoruegeria sp. HB172150]|uniref:dienelactone hydrolase family protein n=1 Tax=Pseudoruegeria sp. HB172150 TaxID=2721164 RepID=UPI00155713DC|nr:hypothetical protein [Pseudoruegeria sp. HB172150]